MKKTLLGTTALVTAGLLAGPALASDPLKVTVGGNVVTGFYAIDADTAPGAVDFQSTKVALVARNIDVKAEGTLDNGLVAGVDAKLQLGNDWISYVNNAASVSTFRQLFAYLEGGFGKFEIGGTDGAAYKMHYTSPWFVPGNGVDSPNIYNASTSPVRVSTFSLLATDSNKVSYFTPRLAGFQLGLSYTPDATVHGPQENGYIVSPEGGSLAGIGYPAAATDVFEVALNYAGSFGGVDVGIDGFYTTGTDDSTGTSSDPEEYGAGLNLGYAGFTLGGAWYQSEDVGSFILGPGVNPGSEKTVWTAGLSYGTGPWKVGVAYLDAQEDNPTTAFFGPGPEENESWQVGGGYNLGSGVDIGLDLQYNTIDTGPAGVGDLDTLSGGLVLAVAF
jgi:predicted porin